MPAFTAVGSYVAGTLLGLAGTAAVVVGSIVAVGAAYVTSRVINGNPNKGGNAAQNQGGRIQVPPATNNKIPVVYGNAYVNGIITDARLTNENKTMYYCIVLSETCNNASAVYGIDNVYWNDLRLTAVDATTNAHKVKDGRKNVEDPDTSIEDFIDTNFIVDGTSLVELRVYAGSTAAADQIYPAQSTGNTQNAYSFWPDSDWTSANQMTGLVFAIVKVNYNGEKGFTGLPNMTFQLANNINNPADVWFDYMTSVRYGANVASSAIDQTPTTSALDIWRDYCDELITYTPVGGGSTTQKRYTINGVIDTARPVKDNIDIILQNGAAWLSYNVSTGQWEPIPKKAATAGELSSALQFTDDNIISGITISSTRLEDLYNKLEVEFYDKYNKDQKAYARLNLSAGLRNPNEPDNQLRMSLDLVNNSVQAELIGQIELRQSRDDLVVEFSTNHYGIQAQAGDVVGITSSLYGWAPKYFRVMRVKEIENENGTLTAQIQALEYNPDVYTVEDITEFTTSANIGIGVYAASPNLPLPPSVIIASVDADAAIPNFELQVTVPATGGPFDEIELYYTEGWDQHPITGSIVPGTGSNGAPVGKGLLTVTATTYGNINPGDRIDLLAPAQDIYIVSQLTNTVGSKTFVSGGVPASATSTLLTLNNVTGLLVGNTLTGTGIPNGSFIIEIDAGTNTVRIEDAVTVQAAGTYTVTGGLGTYVVDTSTTISGTADLYDFPEADNYKLLKKIVPQGNTGSFTNSEVIRDVITTVPANSATYRRWFIAARMGIKKQFGAFSQPGDTDFEQGRFPYNPNPSGAGGAGVFSSVDINNTTPWLTFSTQPDGANPQYGIRGKSTENDPWFIGAGSTGDDLGYVEIATADNAGGTNSGGEIYVRQYNGATPGTGAPWFGGNGTVVRELTLLDNIGYTSIPLRLGINNTSPAYELDVNGSANIDDNLYVTGSTYLGNDYITDTTNVIGGFSVTNNSVNNLQVLYTNGYVGINDATPTYQLDVNGELRATGNVFFNIDATVTGNLAVNGSDITTTDTSTANIFNANATALNIGGASTATAIGATTGTTTIGNDLAVKGTNLILNSDASSGTQDVTILVERGSSGDTYIKYNETTDRFEFASPITTLTNLGIRVSQDLFGTGAHGFIVAGTTGIATLSGDFYFDRNTGTGYPSNNASIYVNRTGGATDSFITWNESTITWDISNSVTIADSLDVATGVLVVDDTTNRVGINNSTPSVALDVVGSILATGDIQGDSITANNRIDTDGVVEMYSTGFGPSVETQVLYFTASGSGLQTVDSWSTSSYRTGKYTISMRKGTDYHCMDVMVIHDDTTAYMNAYSEMFTNASLATLSVDVSVGQVRLRITPTTVGSLEMVIERKLFTAI